jgi:hypothetical protein
MGIDIREALWLTARQVEDSYAIKRSTLDRRVQEGKILACEDRKYGARKGSKRYQHDSIKQYIKSLGNGADKKPEQNYRYNTEKKHPFPTFFIYKPSIYTPIELGLQSKNEYLN